MPLLRLLLNRGQDVFIEDILALFPADDGAGDGGVASTLEVSLSDKERKIVDLLALGLSNREMAERLFVSPNTIKTHLKHIYSKLNVSRRAQAVLKINALGIST
ncbi:MAG: helix-turn-helix transcriptional regulator [Gammaproteobacteria bacterium]|nr:helix-turn-helix transcriptional regulator [Gammaproteobacteria bacterium]